MRRGNSLRKEFLEMTMVCLYPYASDGDSSIYSYG